MAISLRIHLVGWVALLPLAAACTPEVATPTTEPMHTTTTTQRPPITTTTTTTPTTTTEPAPEPTPFVAIAWERGGQLQILVEAEHLEPCPPEGDLVPCGPLDLVREVEVPPGPHNLAAFGSVVLATHPRAGVVSRYDMATGELHSASVGVEPHDVKFSDDGAVAWVADEAGRRIIAIDPDSLETISEIAMPGRPHDLVVNDQVVWVTLVGRPELARISNGEVELVSVGGAPHDLIVDADGRIWLTHWGSNALTIFDPASEEAAPAPAGVVEPHHFALAPDGVIWVSDNGGDTVVGFFPEGSTPVTVGAHPHHLWFLDDLLVVAVSGAGEAVVIKETEVVGRVEIGEGLHGVAVGTVPSHTVLD